MSSYVNYNGNLVRENEVNISVNNRSFKYGDGCFETIKVVNGNILLSELHFTRLFSSLETLLFQTPHFLTSSFLLQKVMEVVDKNGHEKLARVRVTMFRGEGGPHDEVSMVPNFLIQSWEGSNDSNLFNKNGWSIDVYHDAKKSCDNLSIIKSNNYLPYLMGAFYAKKNKLNDCIILNSNNRIADATITNIFMVVDGIIKTPNLQEGCVNGVMRRHLINCLKKESYPFSETKISVDEIMQASEVFLTNAIVGIRWVKNIGNSNYTNQLSSLFHQKFIAPLFLPA